MLQNPDSAQHAGAGILCNRLLAATGINPTNMILQPWGLPVYKSRAPIETNRIPLPGDDPIASLRLHAC